MFEGKIKGIDEAQAGESPILRQLRWTDLMARLAATRDLRGELGKGENEHSSAAATSFAGFRSSAAEAGERGVNQDVLRRGKVTRLERVRAANDAAAGDRENT